MQQQSRLRSLLDSYISGQIPLYELRGQFYSQDLTQTVTDEASLYRMVSIHLAYFTVGNWPEAALKDAIQWHIDNESGASVTGPIPMIDRQWVDITKSGIAPWPVERRVVTLPGIDA